MPECPKVDRILGIHGASKVPFSVGMWAFSRWYEGDPHLKGTLGDPIYGPHRNCDLLEWVHIFKGPPNPNS